MNKYTVLAETIYKRRSVREYSSVPVGLLDTAADLTEVFNVQSLVPDIRVMIRVLKESEVKNGRSDYCIAFYSEEKPLYLENIGFIGQQIDLELQSRGLGTCWWGMKKPKKDYRSEDGLTCIITMTAGQPKNTETRSYPDGFKRKAAKDILIGGGANIVADGLIEAVRIAPSAVNLQPWLVEKEGNKYSFYIRPPKGLMEKMIGNMRRIDMGIALAHLFVAARSAGQDVIFDFDGRDRPEGAFVAGVVVGEQ